MSSCGCAYDLAIGGRPIRAFERVRMWKVQTRRGGRTGGETKANDTDRLPGRANDSGAVRTEPAPAISATSVGSSGTTPGDGSLRHRPFPTSQCGSGTGGFSRCVAVRSRVWEGAQHERCSTVSSGEGGGSIPRSPAQRISPTWVEQQQSLCRLVAYDAHPQARIRYETDSPPGPEAYPGEPKNASRCPTIASSATRRRIPHQVDRTTGLRSMVPEGR